MRFEDDLPKGVIPATLLAMQPDGSVDWTDTRRHLSSVAGTDGIEAITVNGHASEVHACTLSEQLELLDAAGEIAGDRIPIISGIYADNSAEASRIARSAANAGAGALLVFPPAPLAIGGQLRPDAIRAHVASIADACDLPLILFVYPASSGLQPKLDDLVRLVEAVPPIRAIKDWCNDPVLHARHVRALQTLPRPVNVLTTHSAWLLPSLVTGCAGLLSGSGSVIADLHVALWRAVQLGDLVAARSVADQIAPLAEEFYRPPLVDMHNRMKEALVSLGRMERAVVRAPLVKLPAEEIAHISAAVDAAGIAREGALEPAA